MAKQANINMKRRAPNTEVKWTATCLKLGDALTPPCDLMWPFRAGKLLNSFKHIEHVSLFFASALSGSVSLFWPLFLFSFFLAWNKGRDISLACSFHCRESFLVKEVNKILQLDGYEATSKHRVSAGEYVGNKLDQLLPRWGEGKFWVGHAHQNMALGMKNSENPRDDRPTFAHSWHQLTSTLTQCPYLW